MSPIHNLSSTIKASLYSKRIPKKTNLNPFSALIKFGIECVHIKHYLLRNSPEERSSPDFPAVAHHIQKYACNFN